MKNNIFKVYLATSVFLFCAALISLGYLCFRPNANQGFDWFAVSLGHSSNPLISTNLSDRGTYVFDGGRSCHFTIEKNCTRDIGGNYLTVFNQNLPYERNAMVAILENSAMTNKTFHRGLGIEFGHGEYTSRAFGYVANDRIHLTSFDGYGIHYYVIAHTIERDKTWWTLMISLWYPIVFFGILPSVFLAKKLRGRKLALTPKKEPHERP